LGLSPIAPRSHVGECKRDDDVQRTSPGDGLANAPRWKRAGSRRRRHRPPSHPHPGRQPADASEDVLIQPADTSVRVLFASRRSPVRSRLAPSLKCLQMGGFYLATAVYAGAAQHRNAGPLPNRCPTRASRGPSEARHHGQGRRFGSRLGKGRPVLHRRAVSGDRRTT
jgi:hypothetical protein